MQKIPVALDCTVYVDYAHTEESLRQVLTTLRGVVGEGRIITVF